MSRKEFIYLIENCDDEEAYPRYKIGYSKHPEFRIKELQTGNPKKLVIVHKFETKHGMGVETYLHNFYDYKRGLGEWFNLDSSEVKNFMNVCERIESGLSAIKKDYFD